MQFFIPSSIAVATLVGFICGSIWFSPALFLKALFIGEGVLEKDIPKRSKLYIIQVTLYSLVAHGVIVSVLALMFDLLQVNSLKVAISVGLILTLGFIVSKNFMDMIYSLHKEHWKKKNQIKFLVNSGYYIVMIASVSATLFLLS